MNYTYQTGHKTNKSTPVNPRQENKKSIKTIGIHKIRWVITSLSQSLKNSDSFENKYLEHKSLGKQEKRNLTSTPLLNFF